jgi:hypothetical protein
MLSKYLHGEGGLPQNIDTCEVFIDTYKYLCAWFYVWVFEMVRSLYTIVSASNHFDMEPDPTFQFYSLLSVVLPIDVLFFILFLPDIKFKFFLTESLHHDIILSGGSSSYDFSSHT